MPIAQGTNATPVNPANYNTIVDAINANTVITGAESPTAPEILIHNTTEEDGDGGREGSVRFKGEQSGGEETTLAMIRGSHDGAGDDEKGKIQILVNDTNDGDSPTLHTSWNADGSLQHGDGGTTDYIQFAVDGTVTLVGTARTKQHIKFVANEGFVAGVQDPTSAVVGEFFVQQFSQAVTQNLYFTFAIPEDWDETTEMLVHIHWAPVDGNAGDVVWDLDYAAVASENNEVLTAAATALTVTDSTQSLQDELLESPNMTIVAANIAHEDIISLHLSRDTGDGADTYGSAASMVLVEIEYTVHSLGE